jgi:hypothetical protein
MKRFFIAIGLVAAVGFCAVLSWANAPARLAEEPQKKANPANKVVAGEVAIEANCPLGQLAHGEVTFPQELPKVPLVFLMENRQTGAVVVFKADDVTTKGFKWAGCKIWGDERYKTNLAWVAVLPD